MVNYIHTITVHIHMYVHRISSYQTIGGCQGKVLWLQKGVSLIQSATAVKFKNSLAPSAEEAIASSLYIGKWPDVRPTTDNPTSAS